jgi:Cobyrinic acid a,c-diamide synthase
VRIGIARDAAFGFYYPDDLRALTLGGAELVPFSPISDQDLPEVDALFIGGGFPEYRMAELEDNRLMRQAIRDFVAEGRPLYAECGGLMYLCSWLRWKGERRAMVGVLNAEVEMRDRPQGRGYVRLSESDDFPWPRLGSEPTEIAAHEFHHSAILEPDPDWRYGYLVHRGTGIDGSHDGSSRGICSPVTAICAPSAATAGRIGFWPRFVAHSDHVRPGVQFQTRSMSGGCGSRGG